jgi:hypothetical protein
METKSLKKMASSHLRNQVKLKLNSWLLRQKRTEIQALQNNCTRILSLEELKVKFLKPSQMHTIKMISVDLNVQCNNKSTPLLLREHRVKNLLLSQTDLKHSS